jgi:enoyl-CoA hydratase/carnithine racemase
VNSDFWALLKSINESPDLLGYVQINDSESYSQDDVDALVQFLSKDDELFVRHGRFYGFQHEALAAHFRTALGRILVALLEFEKPVIAGFQGKISGDYLGLALAFDWRLATADTTISFENMRTGIPASPGLTYLLPRYVGIGTAMSLIHRGATIDADEALELGLISEIVDDARDLTDRCIRDIREVTAHNRLLLGLHRRAILPSPDEMQTGLRRYDEAMSRSIYQLRAKQD